MIDEADAAARTKTLSDGDECALCDKPMSEALAVVEDSMGELFDIADGHGLPAENVIGAALHAALDAYGAERTVRWLLRLMEAEAPRLREIVEPMFLMAIKRRGAREDA